MLSALIVSQASEVASSASSGSGSGSAIAQTYFYAALGPILDALLMFALTGQALSNSGGGDEQDDAEDNAKVD